MAISGLIFAGLLVAFSSFHVERQDWPRLALISFIGTLGYFAFSSFGFAHAPAGIGTLIMSTQPMLIALLAWAVGVDKLNRLTIIGLIVSFAGSALLVWGDDISGGTVSRYDLLLGCGCILAASVGWSVYVVFSKPLILKYGPLKVTGLANILAALPCLPFLRPDMVDALRALPSHAIWALIILFTVGTSSVISWNYAAGHARPTLLGMSLYVMPVVAVFAGWLLLGEPITTQIIVAAAVILAGLAISQANTLRYKVTEVHT
jgi:drug/metabolite transporter (DMT)-like permease